MRTRFDGGFGSITSDRRTAKFRNERRNSIAPLPTTGSYAAATTTVFFLHPGVTDCVVDMSSLGRRRSNRLRPNLRPRSRGLEGRSGPKHHLIAKMRTADLESDREASSGAPCRN
jgi:hypothetical protein